MSNTTINRRSALQLMGAAAAMPVISQAEKVVQLNKAKFTYCLNLSTIRGQKLGFMGELEVAAKAGYGSVEIWIDTLREYLDGGGKIAEIKSKLSGLGLKVENCIAFAKWVVDDEATRKQAMEQMKTEMGLVAEIGCKRIAATGMGLTSDTTITLDTIAERYHNVLDLGLSIGVIPLLEMWGFQKQMSTASEVTYSAMQSGGAQAKILLDVFHLYKGGTPLDTLSFMNPDINPILHMNDYPPTLSRAVITDADRIYPGDGVAPIKRILQILQHRQEPLILSVELFNAEYYKQDALTVAKTALAKMKAVAEL
ncbi:MAG: sugar phosphate isomerase/epimerase family protein [Mucilaginibacter sp.]